MDAWAWQTGGRDPVWLRSQPPNGKVESWVPGFKNLAAAQNENPGGRTF